MLTGNLYKAICLEDGSRVSVQNSSFEQYEVAVCAFNTDTHVAMGFSRVDDSVEVTAEICDDAGATLRNSEIDADLIMGLFSNSQGKITLENNSSRSTVEERRKARFPIPGSDAAASILVCVAMGYSMEFLLTPR